MKPGIRIGVTSSGCPAAFRESLSYHRSCSRNCPSPFKSFKKSFNLSKQVTDLRVKPAGEWNTLEVTARGKVLTLWVNGGVTCQFEDCGPEKGYLGLEGEGYRIEFRNLKVKELR